MSVEQTVEQPDGETTELKLPYADGWEELTGHQSDRDMEVPAELREAISNANKLVIWKALHDRFARHVPPRHITAMAGVIDGRALVLLTGFDSGSFVHTMSYAIARIFCSDEEFAEKAQGLAPLMEDAIKRWWAGTEE